MVSVCFRGVALPVAYAPHGLRINPLLSIRWRGSCPAPMARTLGYAKYGIPGWFTIFVRGTDKPAGPPGRRQRASLCSAVPATRPPPRR
jgi:hypothetical protein